MYNRWKIALGAGALALATTSSFALAQVAGGTLSLSLIHISEPTRPY